MKHVMLARTFQKYAEALALQTEVEAMKADNAERMQRNEALAYPASEFLRVSNEINHIAEQLYGISLQESK